MSTATASTAPPYDTFGRATHLLVLDFEATGPQVVDGTDEIVEVAAILVEIATMKELGYYTRIIPATRGGLNRIESDFDVRQMHERSGLLEQLRTRVVTPEEYDTDLARLDEDLLEMLDDFDIASGRVVIAGSGISTLDLPTIQALLPKLTARCVYYPADIAVVRRFLEMAGASTGGDVDSKTHRAIDAARCHLHEIRHCLDLLARLRHPEATSTLKETIPVKLREHDPRLVVCPVCNADPGQSCRDDDESALRVPHYSRTNRLHDSFRRREIVVVAEKDLPAADTHRGQRLRVRRHPQDPNLYVVPGRQASIPASATTFVGFVSSLGARDQPLMQERRSPSA